MSGRVCGTRSADIWTDDGETHALRRRWCDGCRRFRPSGHSAPAVPLQEAVGRGTTARPVHGAHSYVVRDCPRPNDVAGHVATKIPHGSAWSMPIGSAFVDVTHGTTDTDGQAGNGVRVLAA